MTTGRPRSPFFDLLGMRIEMVEPGRARTFVDVAPAHMQSQGAVHGGVVFSLADTAVGAAVRSLVGPGMRMATVEAKINYLAPTSAGELVAESRVVHHGKTLYFGECDVFNAPEGQGSERALVARFSATFIVRSVKASEEG